MTRLSQAYGSGPLSLTEIARTEQLPLAYLEQLVGELRRARLVEGTRGLHGGYCLSRAPTAITVGEIYRVLEGPIAPVECTTDDYEPGACTVENGCLSRSIWLRVQASVSQVLDSTTLADLASGCGAPDQGGFAPLEVIQGLPKKVGCAVFP